MLVPANLKSASIFYWDNMFLQNMLHQFIYIYIYIYTSLKVLMWVWRHFQGCGVQRFFRILTPSHKLFKFKKSTPDFDSPLFENQTPTPNSSWKHTTPPTQLHNPILSQVLGKCNIAEDPLVRKDSLPCRNSMFELNNFSFLFSLIEH